MPRPIYHLIRHVDGRREVFASVSSRALAEMVIRRCRQVAPPGARYELQEEWDGQIVTLAA